MRVLITGITGFVGGHLAERLLQEAQEVMGCSRSGKWKAEDADRLASRVPLHACDLCSPDQVRRCIRSVQPDVVYHLAGLANPQRCRREPEKAMHDNVDGTRNLYEALVGQAADARVLYVSSSYVYGKPVPADLPLKETAPLRGKGHPYADSKLQAEQLAARFAERGLKVICVRPFNHAGPRQRAHMIAEWTRQIARIEAGRESHLAHGNLTTRRDWTDVRDVVHGYELLLERGEPGEVYNIGSGISRSGAEVLEQLRPLASKAFETRLEPTLERPDDAPEIVADVSRLKTATGWKPEIDFQTTLRDTLDYWRRKEGAGL